MKSVRSHLGCLLVIILSACTSPEIPPPGEKCVIMSDASCFCINDKLQEDDPLYEYTLDKCENYIAVSPARYKEVQIWAENLIKRLQICKVSPDKCQ